MRRVRILSLRDSWPFQKIHALISCACGGKKGEGASWNVRWPFCLQSGHLSQREGSPHTPAGRVWAFPLMPSIIMDSTGTTQADMQPRTIAIGDIHGHSQALDA